MDLSSSAVSSSSFEDVGDGESCRWTGADAGSVSNYSELGNMSEAVSDISGGGAEVSYQDLAERMQEVDELSEPNDVADGQGKGQGSSSRGERHSKIRGLERFYQGKVLRVETEML